MQKGGYRVGMEWRRLTEDDVERVHRDGGERQHGELAAVVSRLLGDGHGIGVDGEPHDHGDEHRHGQLDLKQQPMQPGPDAVVARDGASLRAVAAASAREAGADAEEDGEHDEVPHCEEAEAAGALVEGRLREGSRGTKHGVHGVRMVCARYVRVIPCLHEDEEAPGEDGRAHQ